MTSVEAAAQLGQALAVLANAGVCSTLQAGMAILTATPAGGTPERQAALDALRHHTTNKES